MQRPPPPPPRARAPARGPRAPRPRARGPPRWANAMPPRPRGIQQQQSKEAKFVDENFPDDDAFEAACLALSKADCPLSWRPTTREAFHALAKWKQKKLVEALSKPKPLPEYKFPHGDSSIVPLSIKAASKLHWTPDLIVGVEKSSAGSSGVYFVELTKRRALVIKVPSSSDLVPEIFGNELAKSFGVCAPEMRAVARHSAFGCAIIESLLSFEAKMSCGERYWLSSKLNIMTSFTQHVFLLMEYVPGISLAELSYARNGDGNERFDKHSMQNLLQSEVALESFGQVIALDMVLNNLDRIRTVRSWPESNPENIYLSRVHGRVVAIDSVASWGDYRGGRGGDEASFQERMLDIEAVVAELSRKTRVDASTSSGHVHVAFDLVRKLLLDGLSDTPLSTKMWHDPIQERANCEKKEDRTGNDESAFLCAWPGLGIDIGLDGVLCVQRGFMRAAKNIVSWSKEPSSSLGPDNRFEDMLKQIKSDLLSEMGDRLVERNQWKAIISGMVAKLGATPQFRLDDGRVMIYAPTEDESSTPLDLIEKSSRSNPKRCLRVVVAFARGLDALTLLPRPDSARNLCFADDFKEIILNGKKTATTRVDNFVTESGDVETVGDLQIGDLVSAVVPSGQAFAVLAITKVEQRTLEELDDELALLENFDKVHDLKDALATFYPSLVSTSELIIVHFRLVEQIVEL